MTRIDVEDHSKGSPKKATVAGVQDVWREEMVQEEEVKIAEEVSAQGRRLGNNPH